MGYVIRKLHTKYFQKSRVFLYPILEVKRGGKFPPLETYMAWEGHFEPQDRKFVCVYPEDRSQEAEDFRQKKLFNNAHFDSFHLLEDGNEAFVFTLINVWEDYAEKVLKGKYSQIEKEHKERILSTYRKTGPHFPYVESYLYPEWYYSSYSKLIGESVETLTSVGELCNAPDLEKETLRVKEKVLLFGGS
jgi:hypothetical protein